MSRPKGNRVQRSLISIAREVFEPFGCTVEPDFSTRSGHQKVDVTFPDGSLQRLDILGTPRSEGNALVMFRQRCKRILRSRGME